MSNIPDEIKLLQKSRVLSLVYGDKTYTLPCDYLRVFSPAADPHHQRQEKPTYTPGKLEVNISSIEPVGNYAIKLFFDDGHRNGIYSWELLEGLALSYQKEYGERG